MIGGWLPPLGVLALGIALVHAGRVRTTYSNCMTNHEACMRRIPERRKRRAPQRTVAADWQ